MKILYTTEAVVEGGRAGHGRTSDGRLAVELSVPKELGGEGGLGTNVAGILEAIEIAWSPAGVAILVDLGGAETNSEMAVEMLPEDRRARVVVCNAPVVEGAVIAATESSGGSSLTAVQRSAEEFYA